MKTALLSYWQFLKYPRLLRISSSKKDLKNDFLTLLVLNFLFASLIMAIYYALLSLKLIIEYNEPDMFQWGFLMALLLGAIVAPINEECIFRWQLRKLKVSIYFVMLSLMFSMLWFTKDDYILFFGGLILLAFANVNQAEYDCGEIK